MDDHFWISLAAKMLLAAVIVLVAAKVVQRTDAFLGAMVATLPVSAGPTYVFRAMEHGEAFIAQSSLVSLTINTGTSAFVICYAYLAQGSGAIFSTGLGLLACIVWNCGLILLRRVRAPRQIQG